MKAYLNLLVLMLACLASGANPTTYTGSTPAHQLIRQFLRISLTDSIDFIRWKLEINPETFQLQCQYGLAKPGTPGFSNEQSVAFEGRLNKSGNYYSLKYRDKDVSILEVNTNVLHFLDDSHHLLIGNGGYSYALNSIHPVPSGAGGNFLPVNRRTDNPQVYEGRTPCRDLSNLLGLNKSEACNKLKWYFLFYTDPTTGKPSYFLMGGTGYRKETMLRGQWQIESKPNGQIIYRVFSDKWIRPLILFKGDDNILFFADTSGTLLVGNEDFSYTLNRRKEAYTAIKK